MKVKFWGVRGSIPSPISGKAIRKKIEKVLSMAKPSDLLSSSSIEEFLESLKFSMLNTYGGNTTCLELRDKDNQLVIIDAGTGLRELGNSILEEGFMNGRGRAFWVFTHTHWDHLQGIPFFVPIYIPGNLFDIYSSVQNLEEKLKYQHKSDHFPMPYEGLSSTKNYHFIPEGQTFELGKNLKVFSKSVRHPGGCFSYRFEEDGKVFIFASDAEFNLEEMENIEQYMEYFQNADVLVFDTQYTIDESLKKIDWGHSSASIATDIALKANVKKLVLFHHDPSYDDEKLDTVFLRALNYKSMMNQHHELKIIMAYEGLELEI
ncbi:MAG: MBL fold metallo-hydrolase [Leptospiraceae bacterium]|nr:MBL fold metallo-hydrolase [Leptospiraceae bacterium]MCP5496111.1 MBL fold metallo-hydrolase [Leptospiraceae bacterium]